MEDLTTIVFVCVDWLLLMIRVGNLLILDRLIDLEWYLRLSQQKIQLLHFDRIIHGFVLENLVDHTEPSIIRHDIAIKIVKAATKEHDFA